METLSEILGLALVIAGAAGAGFEFRMIRSRFSQQLLTPAARRFQTYVIVVVVGLALASNVWHNAAVTWTLTGLAAALVVAQGVLITLPKASRRRNHA